MPNWAQILNELNATRQGDRPPDCDSVRRAYLKRIHEHTRRPAILYAADFMSPRATITEPKTVSINDEDMQGFMTVSQALPGPSLDLILHSPGGSAEAAEAIVTYLRTRFDDVRVIVPQLAMSAATMLACSADKIVMGKHSFLGPIDPQFILHTRLGPRAAPAQAILDQFQKAADECKDPARIVPWLPMLEQYGPDLLVQCETAIKMSEDLVRRWLREHMFSDDPRAHYKARRVARWLASHANFRSHSRHIPRGELEARGLRIERLEADPKAQDLFLSVYHSTTHTFGLTGAVKIIENHFGTAFIRSLQPIVIQGPQGPSQPDA